MESKKNGNKKRQDLEWKEEERARTIMAGIEMAEGKKKG